MNSNNDKNRFDDLLIFGYACKIFRDDEKALHIDQGKHLIPWMGDNNLKIDRYDVRAALTDISQHEAPPGGYDNRLDYLSAAEQKAEQLCEEERYFSLYNNDIEEELYKEEELKRLKTRGYGQIGFNYDQSVSTSNDSPGTQKKDDDDEDNNRDGSPEEAYVPHPKFFIPPNMELPKTTKIHAIIEKTAKFISTQGPQMEILIKAKQANNLQFEFLNQSSRLNPFYKHTLQAMKDGNYPTEGGQAPIENFDNNIESSGSIFANYYNTSANQPKIHVPAIKYKPSADCAYTQLISKIKGVPIATETTSTSDRSATSSPNPQSPKPSIKSTEVEVKKISSGLMLAQYYNTDSENDDDDDDDDDDKFNKQSNGNSAVSNITNTQSAIDLEAPVPPGILCPPPEQRVIIDKTAAYVLKNGKEFEDILRSKNDERFTFLQYKNEYYKYYTYKVTGIVCPDPIQTNLPTQMAAKFENEDNSKKLYEMNKQIGPVSFTIKPKEDSTTIVALKPVLPLEHSSDEDDDQKTKNGENKTSNHHQYSLTQDLPLPPDFQQHNNLFLQSATTGSSPSSMQKKKSNTSLNASTGEVEQSDSFIRDTILDQPNLEQKKLTKRAEDKVKDRLAQIAREKLGIVSKEKQLQLERKKRAMAFLNQIGGPSTAENADEVENSKIESSTKSNPDNSDSGDSVTFVSATTSTSSQTTRRQRHLRTKHDARDSDSNSDVVEIVSKGSVSRSRSRSRSVSSKRYHHKSKQRKKKSHRHRSRSRSQSKTTSRSRYSRSNSRDHKRKRRSPSHSRSKRRKHRYSND